MPFIEVSPISNNYRGNDDLAMRRVYLDNNATTCLDSEVLEHMLPYMRESYGNPSSIHWLGDEATAAMTLARKELASVLGCYPSELAFTSGGTEADNMAIIGGMKASGRKGRVITSSVEHSAVLDVCHALHEEGHPLTVLPVDDGGLVDPEDLEKAMDDDVVLVSIMAANNVVGTIQPLKELIEISHAHGALFHTDAVQGFCRMPLDLRTLKVDMLSVSAHKIHGPKGVGALFIREGTPVAPLTFGGGQEGGIRPSTENVPGIVGLGKAALAAYARMDEANRLMASLRDRLVDEMLKIDDTHLNGHRSPRLANNAHFRIDGVNGTGLVLKLSDLGIAASTASACSASSPSPSHVLTAMGLTWDQAESSLRLGLSHHTTDEDVDYVLEKLPAAISTLRKGKRFNPTTA